MGTYLKAIIFSLVMVLSGCASFEKPSTLQTVPQLDSYLATPVEAIPYPLSDDYDIWQEWTITKVLPALTECRGKHTGVVSEWQKMVDKQKN